VLKSRLSPTRTADRESITDLAEQESVTDAYICRLLPLTCLAPDIVEAILDGRQPKGLRLAEILGTGPVAWDEQRARSGFERGGNKAHQRYPDWGTYP
jgi:hypothetical protein